MPVWPGDTEFALTLTDWVSVRVGAATLSLHTGTHVDAPLHFDAGGAAIAAMPVETYVGAAQVIDARGRESLDADLFTGVTAPRVLVRTDAWDDPAVFPKAVPTLRHEAVAALAAAGVLLFGVDLPSVDELDSQSLPIHHALADAGIAILESVDLTAIDAGRYELIALPLRLTAGDASPVRALIRATMTP